MSSTHAHGEADRHGDDLEELDAPIVGAKRAAFLSRCRASSSAMHQHDPSSSSPAICAHTGSAAAATAHDDVDDAAHATLEAFLNAPESTNTVVREWYAESHHVDPAQQLSCGASSSPLTSSATRPTRDVLHDDDVDELEVVEVEESTAVVSGNLQRVLGNGPLEVATTFDNFFEEDGTQTHGPAEHSATTTTTTPATTTNARVVRKVPSLDTILGLHEPRDDAAPSPPPTPEKMMGPAMEEDDAHGTTSIASVVLPGLEDPSSEEEEEEEEEHNHSNNNCVGARPSHSHTTAAPADFVDADVRRQLQAVAEDVDNHVQPFSMDPMFDYDADVVGSDARRGGGRRGAAEALSHVVKKEAPREGVEDEGGEQMTPS